MAEPAPPPAPLRRPTLFRQIALRLAAMALAFEILNIAIVVTTYGEQPEALAHELLSLEAERIAADPAAARHGPPGATHWLVREQDSPGRIDPDGSAEHDRRAMVDWTQRERTADGFRISGVRAVTRDGRQRWLYLQFEGDGLAPYVPVIRNEILQHVLLPLLPLSLMMLAFAVLAVRRVLDPLRRAEREIDALAPQNMADRLTEPDSPREVHALVGAVNRALGRLEQAIATLREFTANAAHELRTPLAIMQLAIDRLPAGPDREALARDNLAMSRLVAQMLDLAQADALQALALQPVDLAAIAREAVAALAGLGFAADRELRFEQQGDAPALGHSEALLRILRNLVENALAHSGDAGPVEVRAGPGPVLVVRDHGKGIPPADRERIFERFWRGDRRESNGAGLGLGIVRRLVEAMGGTILVEDARGGGAEFRITLQAPDVPAT